MLFFHAEERTENFFQTGHSKCCSPSDSGRMIFLLHSSDSFYRRKILRAHCTLFQANIYFIALH